MNYWLEKEKEIVFFKIGNDRKAFYPYGESLVAQRHMVKFRRQLKLMEDALAIYLISRSKKENNGRTSS